MLITNGTTRTQIVLGIVRSIVDGENVTTKTETNPNPKSATTSFVGTAATFTKQSRK
jgi:hypothetical protein